MATRGRAAVGAVAATPASPQLPLPALASGDATDLSDDERPAATAAPSPRRRVAGYARLVGRRVQRQFDKGLFAGRVISSRHVPPHGRVYLVRYSDGDKEELLRSQVLSYLIDSDDEGEGRAAAGLGVSTAPLARADRGTGAQRRVLRAPRAAPKASQREGLRSKMVPPPPPPHVSPPPLRAGVARSRVAKKPLPRRAAAPSNPAAKPQAAPATPFVAQPPAAQPQQQHAPPPLSAGEADAAAFLRSVDPPLQQLGNALAALAGSGITRAHLAKLARAEPAYRHMLLLTAAAALRLCAPGDLLSFLAAAAELAKPPPPAAPRAA